MKQKYLLKSLFLLTLMLAGSFNGAWADPVVGTYTTRTLSNNDLTSTWAFNVVSGSSVDITTETTDNDMVFIATSDNKIKMQTSSYASFNKDTEVYIPVPSGSAGSVSVSISSGNDSRYFQLWVNGNDGEVAGNEAQRLYSKLNSGGGISSDGKKGPQSFTFTSSNIVTKGGKTYLHFKSPVGEMKTASFTITLTTGTYATGPQDPEFSISTLSIEIGATATISGPNGLTFTATPVSGTTGEVSVSGSTITGVTAGAAQVRIQSEAVANTWNAYDQTFDITVTAPKTATTLSFNNPTTTVEIGSTVTNEATLSPAVSGATITYASDNTNVATVDGTTGEVTGVAVGSATITATYAGNDSYKGSTAGYTINVPLTAIDTKFWTSAGLLAAVGGSSTNVTDSRYIDNLEVKGTSGNPITITTGGNKTIEGDTFGGRVRLGKAGSADGNYLHFKVKPNTKITFYGIRASNTAMENGLALSFGSFGTNEQVYSFTAGDVESLSYAYTGAEDTDVYAYSKASAGASMMAIKLEPITEDLGEVQFSPAGGTYYVAQNVTLTAQNAEEIWYSTVSQEAAVKNGANATQYTTPIAISETTTLYVTAYKGAETTTGSASYTINIPDLDERLDVTGQITWEWSDLAGKFTATDDDGGIKLTASTHPAKSSTEEVVLSNVDKYGEFVITYPESFKAQYIAMKNMDYVVRTQNSNTFAQGGGSILFKTTLPGKVAITFTSTSSNNTGRYVAVGDVTGTIEATMTQQTEIFNVAAGEVEIKGGSGLRFFKITFTPAVTVSFSAYDMATFACDYDLDFSEVDGVEAYKAQVGTNSVKLTKVDAVPAGEGFLLKATTDLTEATNFTIPITTGLTAWTDNDFIRGEGVAVPTTVGNKTNYILSTKSDVVGFYYANDKVVATNRAYLSVTTSSAPELSMEWGEGTTGIRSIDNGQLIMDNVIYDLNGRRVENPTKGVYIMNGKKVVIK